MIEVRQTETFETWFADLRDIRAKAKINARIRMVTLGNLGDAKSIGDGVAEMRINYGPGYRLYFVRKDDTLVILLCGGDKGSQDRDILKAKELAEDL